MVLLIYFIILLCIALPLGEVTRVTLGLSVSFTLLDVVIGIGALIYSIQILRQKPKKISKFAVVFFLVLLAFSLSLILNYQLLSLGQMFVASLYIIRFFSLGLLFFIVKNSSSQVKKYLPKVLMTGGSLLLLGGYVQYFFYPSLRNLIYFGWDEHFYRMFGTFFDPNFFGLFLVLFFLYILAKLFTISVEKNKYTFVFLFLLASSTFVGIFLSYSRTALLALVCGLLILFWNRNMWKFIVFLLVGVFVVAFAFLTITNKKSDMNSLLRTTSSEARIGSARDAIKIFLDNPIIGVGFNAYRYSMYRHHFQPGSSIQEDHGASGADSSLLLVLATSGVIGLITFLFFLFIHAQKLGKSKQKVGLATLIALFVGSFFVNGLFYPLLLTWLWVVIGITESSQSEVL